MKNILTLGKRAEFEKLVRITKNIDEKDRLRAILAYDEGHVMMFAILPIFSKLAIQILITI